MESDFAATAHRQDELIAHHLDQIAKYTETGSASKQQTDGMPGIAIYRTELDGRQTVDEIILSKTAGNTETELSTLTRYWFAGGRLHEPVNEGAIAPDTGWPVLKNLAGRILGAEMPTDDLSNSHRAVIISCLTSLLQDLEGNREPVE